MSGPSKCIGSLDSVKQYFSSAAVAMEKFVNGKTPTCWATAERKSEGLHDEGIQNPMLGYT